MAIPENIENAVRYWARIMEVSEDNMVAMFSAMAEPGGYIYRNNLPIGGIEWDLSTPDPESEESIVNDWANIFTQYFSVVFPAFGLGETEAKALVSAFVNNRVDGDGLPDGTNILTATTPVPNLAPYTIDTFEAALSESSLRVGDVGYIGNQPYPAGAVVWQYPASGVGAIPYGTVDVNIHIGWEVPEISTAGSPISYYTFNDYLHAFSLRVGSVTLVDQSKTDWVDPITGDTWDLSTQFSPGDIIYCNPEPGSLLGFGEQVDVTVIGRTVPTIDIGNDTSYSVDTLEGAGFNVTVINVGSVEGYNEGIAVGCFPPPGHIALEGDNITLFVTPE